MRPLLAAMALTLVLAPPAQACDGLSHYDPYHDICTPGQTDMAPYYTPHRYPPGYFPHLGLDPGLDYN